MNINRWTCLCSALLGCVVLMCFMGANEASEGLQRGVWARNTRSVPATMQRVGMASAPMMRIHSNCHARTVAPQANTARHIGQGFQAYAPWTKPYSMQRNIRVFAGDEEESGAEDKLLEAEDRMRKSITALQSSLMTVSTGRANPAALDRVQVDYYGALTPIRSLAGITAPSAQELIVDPYDKSSLPDVERAIFQANLGLTPSNDGKIIRISVPMLTEDRRKELAKSVKKFGEEAKVAIRNIRRDAVDFVKKAEKNKKLSEDDSKYYQGEAQTLTDKISKEIDTMIANKQKDLMTV